MLFFTEAVSATMGRGGGLNVIEGEGRGEKDGDIGALPSNLIDSEVFAPKFVVKLKELKLGVLNPGIDRRSDSGSGEGAWNRG